MKKIKYFLTASLVAAIAFVAGLAPTASVSAATGTAVTTSATTTITFDQATFDLDYPTIEMFEVVDFADYFTTSSATSTLTYSEVGTDLTPGTAAGVVDVYADGTLEVRKPGNVSIKVNTVDATGYIDENDYVIVSFTVDGESITDITVSHTDVTLKVGESTVVELGVTPANADDAYIFLDIAQTQDYDVDVFDFEKVYSDYVTGEDAEYADYIAGTAVWAGKIKITGAIPGKADLVITDSNAIIEKKVNVTVVEEPTTDQTPAKTPVGVATGDTTNTSMMMFTSLLSLCAIAFVAVLRKEN